MPGDLDRRLRVLEESNPPEALWCVLLFVCGTCRGGTSVSLCFIDVQPRMEHVTLREYRTRYGEQDRDRERWTIAGDAEPDPDRQCVHWSIRRVAS